MNTTVFLKEVMTGGAGHGGADMIVDYLLVKASHSLIEGHAVDGVAIASTARRLIEERQHDEDRATVLRALSEAIQESTGILTPGIFHALCRYADWLVLEGLSGALLPVLELIHGAGIRLGIPESTLPYLFRQYIILVRGMWPIRSTAALSLTLAVQAKQARSREYIGFARALEGERAMLTGNLPRAQRLAERLLAWSLKHGYPGVESSSYAILAATHGRAMRPVEAVRFAALGTDDRFSVAQRVSSLILLGNAFIDLQLYTEARACFELVAGNPSRAQRRLALMGLMDLSSRMGDRQGFEYIRGVLAEEPVAMNARVIFLRDAGQGWARFGEMALAHRDIQAAHDIAVRSGYGLEILQTEKDLESLAAVQRETPKVSADSLGLTPESTRVMTLRANYEPGLVACFP